MPDQIEKLFADLRADTLPTVRLPGTEPLRRAARRRRAVISSATAVTVLGLAALIAVIRPDSSPGPVVSPPSAAPTYDRTTLTAMVTETLQLDDPQHAGLSGIIPVGSGLPESQRPVLGGTYSIRMTCYGSGSMDVTVSDTVVQAVPCTTPGTVWTASVVVPEPSGQLSVRAVPRGSGPGQAALGYVAELAQPDKTRWQEAAYDALGSKTDSFAAGGSFFASDGGEGYEHSDLTTGRYRVRAICLGFGSVTLSAGPGTGDVPLARKTTVHCSPDNPQPASLTLSAADGLTYLAEPDADAGHRAAVATVLDRSSG
ncbi:hypothetical protein [Actinoplanes subglobosus]|uniref:Uncharacterized protein n=1 Tax=Actinoplanes subglobosus TaxID=1547892 RepID=A0ABV8IS00_9ACTN